MDVMQVEFCIFLQRSLLKLQLIGRDARPRSFQADPSYRSSSSDRQENPFICRSTPALVEGPPRRAAWRTRTFRSARRCWNRI